MYNGQASVLWQNVRDAFPTEIANMYRAIRSGNVLTLSHVRELFKNHQSVWPERIWNEDAFNKYLKPYLLEGKDYLDMLQGDKSSQFDWWIFGAFNYRDSKYSTGNALTNRIIIRGYVDGDPNNPSDAAKIAQQMAAANITIKPYSHIYGAVQYGSYTVANRMSRNQVLTFNNPLDYMNDTEIYVNSADQLADVGDLSVMRLGKVADFSAAVKLSQLVVGSNDANYRNAYLQNLVVGNNELLTLLNVCNCTALATAIDLSNCTGIETVLASGSAITGLNLPVGGHLKKLVLPNTIANLTIRNQKYFNDFTIAGYSNLSTVRIENTPNVPIESILRNMPGSSEVHVRTRLVGVEWTATSEAYLKDCIDKLDTCTGIDASGRNLPDPVVIGRVNISSISATLLERIQNDYPDLVVVVNGVAQYIVKFYNDDNTLLYSQVVPEGGNATNPVTAGTIPAPTKTNTDTIHYVFKDFGTLPTNVHENSSVIAQYTMSYLVKYVSDTGTVYQSSFVTEGQSVQYTGSTPTKAQTAQYTYTFSSWSGADNSSNGLINSVNAPKTVTAVFSSTLRTYTATFVNKGGSPTLQTVNNVAYGSTPSYTGATPVSPDSDDGAFTGWEPALGPITGDTTYVAKYDSPVEDVEITDDWPTIMDNIANGVYATTYKLGNYKPLDLGTEGIVNMQIVAMDEDVDSAGNTIPVTWIAKESLNTTHNMNSTNDTTGGYPASEMRTYLNTTIKALMLEALVKHVTPAMKTSRQKSPSDAYLNTPESLWIPSAREIFGGTSYENSGVVYNKIFKDATSRIKKLNGSADYWWLRSAYSAYYFWSVRDNGSITYVNAYYTYGVALGFCTGPDTIHDSWEDISIAISNDTYKTKYSIGDTKAVDMGDQGVICFQIAAFDADVDANGDTVPITWVAQQTLVTDHNINSTNDSTGGYPASAMRTYVDGLKSRLPAILQSMIVPVSKTSRDAINSTDITSNLELWIPSYRELYGGTNYEQSGPVYSSLFVDANSRIKKKYGSGSADFWWLRSSHSSTTFRYVSSNGDYYGDGARSTYAVVLGFCTGPRGPVDFDDTWEQVEENIRDESYKTKYIVGDTIPLSIGTSGSEYNGRAQIVAIDEDVDANGNTIPLTFITVDQLNTTHIMNSTYDTTGGYPASEMRTYVDGLESSLPATLQGMLVAANKTSKQTTPSSETLTTALKLWIPSYREIYGGTSYENSGVVYDKIFKDATSIIKRRNGGAYGWWLRSAYDSAAFRNVTSIGSGDISNAPNSYGVVLGFCVHAPRITPADLNDTWEQVSAAIADGSYKDRYIIGDTIPLSIGTNGSEYNGRTQIVAIDKDVDANGNTIPLTFITVNCLNTTHNMNSTNDTTGGYPASAMKTYVDGLESSLPATLQGMLVAANKTSKQTTPSSETLTTALKLWIPSLREIFGGTDYENSGVVYDDIFKDATSRIKKRYGFAGAWWLRSSDSSTHFRCVGSSGYDGYGGASNTYGVVVGFCVKNLLT